MSHAATMKSFQRPVGARSSPTDEDIPVKAKMYYVAIVAALLALIITFAVVMGIAGSLDNSSNPVQQHSNSANPGDTQDTGAPASGTGADTDRTTPSPSGSGGNTLLNPDQP